MKKNSKSITLVVVVMCLATLAVAWTSNWFSTFNMSEWSEKWQALFNTEQPKDPSGDKPTKPDEPDKPTTPDEPDKPTTPEEPNNNPVVAITGKGEELKADGTYNMPSNFAYVCSENDANKSVTLTAAVLPDNATEKYLIWSIDWKEKTNSFVTGKTVTDYVTISINEDTTQCTVTYIADFGAQIAVKVHSRLDSQISTTCTIDCMQKVIRNDVTVRGPNLGIGGSGSGMYTIITDMEGDLFQYSSSLSNIDVSPREKIDKFKDKNDYERQKINTINIEFWLSRNYTLTNENLQNTLKDMINSPDAKFRLSIPESLANQLDAQNLINSHFKYYNISDKKYSLDSKNNIKDIHFKMKYNDNDLKATFNDYKNNVDKIKDILFKKDSLFYNLYEVDLCILNQDLTIKDKIEGKGIGINKESFYLPVESIIIDNPSIVL